MSFPTDRFKVALNGVVINRHFNSYSACLHNAWQCTSVEETVFRSFQFSILSLSLSLSFGVRCLLDLHHVDCRKTNKIPAAAARCVRACMGVCCVCVVSDSRLPALRDQSRRSWYRIMSSCLWGPATNSTGFYQLTCAPLSLS